jgi:hypothetical protein
MFKKFLFTIRNQFNTSWYTILIYPAHQPLKVDLVYFYFIFKFDLWISFCIRPNINTRNHTLIRRGLSFFLIFKVGAGEVNLPLHRCHLDRIWVHLNIGAMQSTISWSSGRLRSNGLDIMISKNKKLLLDLNCMILIEWLRDVNYTWLHSPLTPLNPIPTQSRQIRQWT